MQRIFTRHSAEKRPTVVVETGVHSRWVNELGRQAGLEIVVANPARVRLIHGSNTKADRLDAEALARLARIDGRASPSCTMR